MKRKHPTAPEHGSTKRVQGSATIEVLPKVEESDIEVISQLGEPGGSYRIEPTTYVAPGFERFPMGLQSYRLLAVGCALEKAKLELSCERPDDSQLAAALDKVLEVFEWTMARELPALIIRFARNNKRRLLLKGDAISYKSLDGVWMAYLNNTRIIEQPSPSCQTGNQFTSNSLKLVAVERFLKTRKNEAGDAHMLHRDSRPSHRAQRPGELTTDEMVLQASIDHAIEFSDEAIAKDLAKDSTRFC